MRLRGRIAACAVAGAAAFAGLTTTALAASAAPATTAPAITSTALAAAAESPCPYSGSHPTLYFNQSGPAVEHAQCLINLYGYGIAEDGEFYIETDDAVRDLQNRCRITVDGDIGPNTWNCLHPDKLPNPR